MPNKKKGAWDRYGKCVAGIMGGIVVGLFAGDSIAAESFLANHLPSIWCAVIGILDGFCAGAAASCGGK